MKKILLFICVLLCGCTQNNIKIVQKEKGYTIKEVGNIEAYKFDDLYQPILCEENVVCVNGIDGKYYKVDLNESKILEYEGWMEFNPIIIPNGNERNGFIKNKIMHHLDIGQNIIKISDFRILNEINYIGDVDGVSIYKETYSYWNGNERKVLLELETTNEVPMLSQYLYYDEINKDLYLTYPTNAEVVVYKYQDQSMEKIDTIEYKRENMTYVSSVFIDGKRIDEYEDDNYKHIYINDKKIEFKKDYDYQLNGNYIFAFSKYESDRIIEYTTLKEYEFESNLSLDYPSYWDEKENKFLSYDNEKKVYVYSTFEDNTLTFYELPFGYDAQIFKVNANSYGFIVTSDDCREKTIYLFEMEK